MKKINKWIIISNLILLVGMIVADVLLIVINNYTLKIISSTLFVLSGIINAVYALKGGAPKKFTAFMLSGIIFAMVGDVVIYPTGKIFFILGALFFAIAHVMYVVAYYCLNPFRIKDLIIFAIFLIPIELLFLLGQFFEFNGIVNRIVCMVYAVLLSAMVAKALSNATDKRSLTSIIAIGSVLFFISDSALVFTRFTQLGEVTRIICLGTYYPAQFILAVSLLFANRSGMNVFKAAYCRVFQFALKIALPFLPYRDPEIIGKISQIPQTLSENGRQKPLIVTDRTIRELGLIQTLEDSLSLAHIPYAIYDGVVANPTTENVAQALEIYKNSGCDCLIAVGGGSPMDCAKGVGALIAKPKKSLGDLKGILKVGKKIPLLIAVPTTAGTGSETTLAAVIVDAETRHKYAINDFPLIPRYAVLDEELTLSLPQSVISTTGMDALTHAIEAYIGRGGNKSTRQDALDACKLIFENIEKSYGSPDRLARQNMLIASHKAGRAFSKAYVGYVHSLAHSLGGKYNVPHGLANAVILPIVLREYGGKIHKKLWQIAVYCNLASDTDPYEVGADKLIEEIERLNSAFNIPTTLPVINAEDLEELATYAEREANPLYPVPVLWDREKLKGMYLQIKGE